MKSFWPEWWRVWHSWEKGLDYQNTFANSASLAPAAPTPDKYLHSGQESTLDMYCCIIYTINICAHTNIHIPSYTIMPDLLSDKLTQLSVPTSMCQWITSFLTDRQQLVRLGKLTSRTLTISTDAPQGCVLSPLPFSFYTNDCTSKDPSVKLPKFAEDTTVIGLIEDEDESAY